MPNKHAAIKDLRKSRKHAISNAKMKTHLRALSHQLQASLKDGKKNEALEVSKKLQQALDKAGKSHVIHSNKAARKVSTARRALAKMK